MDRAEHGLATVEEYLAVSRVGRMAALQPGQRRAVWNIRQSYLAARIAGGYPYDWAGLPAAVRALLSNLRLPLPALPIRRTMPSARGLAAAQNEFHQDISSENSCPHPR